MIPFMLIVAWGRTVPWVELRQVEQDLVIFPRAQSLSPRKECVRKLAMPLAPLTPAHAGVQACNVTCLKRLDSRLRGNERSFWLASEFDFLTGSQLRGGERSR